MIDEKFIEKYSKKYDEKYKNRYLEDKILSKIKSQFSKGKTKYLTKGILADIVYWKAKRAKGHAEKNDDAFVVEVTSKCLSSTNEQFKVEGLTLLNGVKYRMATAILHFCFPSKYTIMDYRAWWTLQRKGYLASSYKIKDDFEHWQRYLSVCRKISHRYQRRLRELDKALWKYSKG